MPDQPPDIFAFWCGPRSLSTAMMYSFAQRSDTAVLDEPFFAHFLTYTGASRPSREEVLKTMETDHRKVSATIRRPRREAKLMLKNMANHIEGLPFKDFLPHRHVIQLRHPARVLASYTQQIEEPGRLDLCYEHQLRIVNHLSAEGRPFLVVDADDLQRDPARQLKEICHYLEMDFDPAMLQWEAGARPEDGPWARYWYASVHRSRGWSPHPPAPLPAVPPALHSLYQHSLTLYLQIKNYE